MSPTKPLQLPEGFLDGPAPNLTREDVDWKKGGLPVYDGSWAVVLDGALTEEECEILIEAADRSNNGEWERAMINIGGGFQMIFEETRKCGRIIVDDRETVAKIWARIAASVPEIHRLENWEMVTGLGPWKRKEVWKMTRLNERMRFLKYTGGEYFKPHGDGAYETPDKRERSYFTLHLYLNDPAGKDGQEPLVGGATTFMSLGNISAQTMDIVPKAGRILLFQHRGLIHAGADVVRGTKYTLRTDIMYAKE